MYLYHLVRIDDRKNNRYNRLILAICFTSRNEVQQLSQFHNVFFYLNCAERFVCNENIFPVRRINRYRLMVSNFFLETDSVAA